MSAWDSHKTRILHKVFVSSQYKFNELMKTPLQMPRWARNVAILKTSDMSLSKLMEVDPQVIGSGRFSIFSNKTIHK